jgi:endonuclease/exonuclease/phosphatase family metal-dependent hydrolase
VHARRLAQWSWVGSFCAAALVLATACTSSGSGSLDAGQPKSSSGSVAHSEPMDLSVLEYNVEYGGNASTDKVMQSVGADVVSVLESYNRLPTMAANAGYPYYDIGLQLLSKYPILEPSGAHGLYALIEVQPGYVVAVVNTHLDYVAYGPRLLAQGRSVSDVRASEDEVRGDTMRLLIPSIEHLLSEGYPVFVTGDFNEPSTLDYGADTIGTRADVDQPIRWPVSDDLLALGLHDTYRVIHPDAVADPGATWGNLDGGAGDRIDYIYAGGPVDVHASKIVGKTGGPNVDIPFDKWTSDHRAVLTTVSATPVAMPTTISLDSRMLTHGDELNVSYNAPGATASSIAVTPEGDDTAPAASNQPVSGRTGTLTIDTDTMAPGGYDIALLDDAGNQIATNQFWVRSKVATIDIKTGKSTYAVGEPITVSWNNGPANRWDWVAVYKAGASNPSKDDYLLWGYTGGHASGALPPSVSGSMTFDDGSQGKPWPLPPGHYVVHYLLTDQYTSAGRTAFTVTK